VWLVAQPFGITLPFELTRLSQTQAKTRYRQNRAGAFLYDFFILGY
jgi:hypothetical protein